MWSVPRQWPGETVFILAGGPSVLNQDLSLLKGRRVIAVKSSWIIYPDADVLFFADGRWWKQPELRPKAFAGMVVTTAAEIGDPRALKLKKVAPNALSHDPRELALARTSTTGAINLAYHLTGPTRVVLLGVDGKLAADGRRHCHGLKWPWAKGAERQSFEDQAAEYRAIAPSAQKIGIDIINANPDSAIDAFRKLPFEECLKL